MDFIEHHNAKGSSFVLKMNRFGDMTNTEFKTFYLSSTKTDQNGAQFQPESVPLPTTWDWTAKGGVTPVPNQGQCGNCWVFSALGSVETCHFIQTGKLVPLSVQQLMDCSGSYGNHGCEGGFMTTSFQYIIANGGIDTEACYPITGEPSTCHYKKSCCGSTVTNFASVQVGNETALQLAVFRTAVAVAIDASQTSFQFYSSGVYYEPACSSTNVDHTPLAVGWGVSQGQAYWNLRNSWGEDWGMKGYIWMARNRNNNCGIATLASFPIGCFNC